MDTFTATFDVYSPRWGHTDPYTVEFTKDELRVGTSARTAVCKRDASGDAEWEGHKAGNPLMDIFRNDSIYAPTVVPFALKSAWESWRDNRVSEETLRAGLKELFAWIDQTARGKPAGPLWEGVF